MSKEFNPKIRTSIVSVGEVFDALKDPEGFVRPTTKLDNLKRALDRGTDSTVMRSMGYENLFETFQKKGIDKATVNKFKNIPEITDYLDKDGKLNDTKLNKYNKDLKKFRLDAFKGLSPKEIKIVESSGFLSQFAKDQRNQILKSGGKFNQKNLNKVLDQMFDFTFKDLDTAAGVKKPQIQDKKITSAMDKVDANEKIKPAQKLNIKYGLSQVDKLVKMGNTPAARKLLTAILTLAPKGLFGMDLLIPTTMGSGELPEEGTPEYEQLMKDMGKNQGGMMDINFMTRPLGYKDGTREGELVGDKEKRSTSGQLNQKETDMITESFPGLREFAASEVMRAAGDQKGVDTIQLASNYLRSLQMGLSGNEEAMNAVINILNSKIVPEEQLKLIKEGQSDLGSIAQKAGSGLESLYQKLPDMFQIFGKQEPGEGVIQTMDDRTLEALKNRLMRAQ
tara:strand:- start:85 stop:1434 length:1350 start_codon:yes stop_codon:yes gene_type:complete